MLRNKYLSRLSMIWTCRRFWNKSIRTTSKLFVGRLMNATPFAEYLNKHPKHFTVIRISSVWPIRIDDQAQPPPQIQKKTSETTKTSETMAPWRTTPTKTTGALTETRKQEKTQASQGREKYQTMIFCRLRHP